MIWGCKCYDCGDSLAKDQMKHINNLDHQLPHFSLEYSKTCLKRPLKKKTKIGFQDRVSLHAGQKYCRMLQGELSAILSTFIKLPFVINIFVLSIFEWPPKTGFTVCVFMQCNTSI